MQRASLSSFAFLSTMLVSTAAFSGPLALNPTLARGAENAPPVRQAAQSDYGGGFLEFLFRGAGAQPSGTPYDPGGAPAANYRPYPADLGPGMVESPNQPGTIVMDPRYQRQEVSYDGKEPPGTIIINTRDR